VGAVAEGHAALGLLAVEVEPLGALVDPLVAVRRPPEQQDDRAGLERDAPELGVARDQPRAELHRRLDAQRLANRALEQAAILVDALHALGHRGQQHHHVRHEMRGGDHPADEEVERLGDDLRDVHLAAQLDVALDVTREVVVARPLDARRDLLGEELLQVEDRLAGLGLHLGGVPARPHAVEVAPAQRAVVVVERQAEHREDHLHGQRRRELADELDLAGVGERVDQGVGVGADHRLALA
jgi:hypothetical protein